MKEISNRIIKTELIDWRSLEWLQNKNLKQMTEAQFNRLKESLRKNSFIMPFAVAVWNGDMKPYIIDGHHRQKAMQDLEKEGCRIPDRLPANFLRCADRKEAVHLVLVYSSIYSNVTNDGLYEFMETEGLSLDDIKMDVELPEIDFGKFQQEFFDLDNQQQQEYNSNESPKETKSSKESDGILIPVYFQLTKAQFETWKTIKKEIKISNDLLAFLKITGIEC